MTNDNGVLGMKVKDTLVCIARSGSNAAVNAMKVALGVAAGLGLMAATGAFIVAGALLAAVGALTQNKEK